DERGVRLVSRNNKPLSDSFPELTEPVKATTGGHRVVLDCEIITPGPRSAPSFSRLQHRLGRIGANAADAAKQIPAQLVAFDVLDINGEKLTSKPYWQRRQRLLDVIESGEP